MPRARSDQIISHRIEMGVWEREHLGPLISLGTVAGSIGVVGVGAGAALAAYGLYWFFDAGWGITQNIRDFADRYWEDIREGNVLGLHPLESDGDDESFVKKFGEGTIIDHKWWAKMLGF